MLGKSKTEEFIKVPDPKFFPAEKGKTKTIIGEDISIEGNIRGKGDLVIEGSVNGSIELEKYHLTVGSKGQVEAEIKAGEVTISGRLTGNITALDKVSLTKEADFNGEIKAKNISVQDGAYLNASIELERETQIKSVQKSNPVDPMVLDHSDEPVSIANEAS